MMGDEGLGAWRQMEFEQDFAKSLLGKQNKLPTEIIEPVVESYRQIVKSAREIGNFVRQEIGNDKVGEKIVQNTVHNLMRKAFKKLLDYASNPPSIEQIQTEMADLQSELSIFAATFKESRRDNPETKLQDFAKFQVEAKHGLQIDQETKDQMLHTIIANRMERPDIISQAKTDFEEAIKNPQSIFYLLKYDDKLVGFFRMDRQGELDGYLGSLNVPPSIQGSGIGDEALRRYFTAALNGRIGHASADPRNPITPQYIGRYNFVGTAIKEFGESGRPFIEMRLDPNLNSDLRFFNADNQAIASLYPGDNSYQLDQDFIILRYPESELDNLMADSQSILATGRYVMSAYRKVKQSEEYSDIYSVFEIKPGQESKVSETAFLQAA